MLLEVPNRGNAHILESSRRRTMIGCFASGFTVVSLGWQWDAQAPGALRFNAPIAKDHGKTITGLLRGDFMLAQAGPRSPSAT